MDIDIFNLGSKYTKEELKNKYNDKINEINITNLSIFDKQILINYYKDVYNKKNYKFEINNMFNTFSTNN